VCVSVAWGIQHAMCMRRSHLWPAPLYIFPHYLINDIIFEKKGHCTQNVCSDFLYSVCLKHFSFYEELSEIWSKMYVGLHVKCPLFLPYCNKTWFFSTVFEKSSEKYIFMKSRPLGADLFHADGWTDTTILIVAVRSFTKARKIDGNKNSSGICSEEVKII